MRSATAYTCIFMLLVFLHESQRIATARRKLAVLLETRGPRRTPRVHRGPEGPAVGRGPKETRRPSKITWAQKNPEGLGEHSRLKGNKGA